MSHFDGGRVPRPASAWRVQTHPLNSLRMQRPDIERVCRWVAGETITDEQVRRITATISVMRAYVQHLLILKAPAAFEQQLQVLAICGEQLVNVLSSCVRERQERAQALLVAYSVVCN